MRDLVTAICEYYNCETQYKSILLIIVAIIALLITALKFFIKQIKLIIAKRNARIINKTTLDFYSAVEVQNYTKDYIQQNYQNINPVDTDYNSKHLSVAKKNIQHFFFKNILISYNTHKYILILADTGMGKTAFLINLYLKFINRFKHILSFNELTIKLLPLGNPKSISIIKEIKYKKKCILLLDAFDEDTKALSNFK